MQRRLIFTSLFIYLLNNTSDWLRTERRRYRVGRPQESQSSGLFRNGARSQFHLPVDLERDVIKRHDVETGLWQIDLTVGSSTRDNCCSPCETLGPEMYDQYENPSKAFAH